MAHGWCGCLQWGPFASPATLGLKQLDLRRLVHEAAVHRQKRAARHLTAFLEQPSNAKDGAGDAKLSS